MARAFLGLLAAGLLAALAPAGSALQLPPHFELVPVPGTFPGAVALAFAPDGTAFVAAKSGVVWVARETGPQPAPFLDLSVEVNDQWDRGLLGIALSPGFLPDGGPSSWVYLLYTVSPVPGEDIAFDHDQKFSFSRLTRYRALAGEGGAIVAVAASRQVLLGHQQPDGSVPDGIASLHDSHSNGALVFGSDGTLLVATGDGAHYDQTDHGGLDAPGFDDWIHPVTGLRGPTPAVEDSGSFRAQDLRSLAGKILRLDPETGSGLASNPFYDGDPASHASRVWALGFRNPFRMVLVPGTGSADPGAGEPGELLVGDVGWQKWEELDRVRGGENLGWPCSEAFEPTAGYADWVPGAAPHPTCAAPGPGVPTAPILAWHHAEPQLLQPAGLYQGGGAGFSGRCVIAGAFATAASYPPELAGRFVASDYDGDWVRTLSFDSGGRVADVQDFALGLSGVVDAEAHPVTGEVYLVGWIGWGGPGSSRLWRLRFGTNLTPIAKVAASPSQGPAPLAVALDAGASLDPDGDPLEFRWDPGDGSPELAGARVQHTYAAEGVYTARLSAEDPLGASATAEVTVWVGNTPPVIQMLSPLQGATFAPPVEILLSGLATDLEDPAPAISWEVHHYHNEHVHPAVFRSSSPEAHFAVGPHAGEGDVEYFEVVLTATDSQGLATSTRAFVYPAGVVRDATGTAPPIARIQELLPPVPQGNGNLDLEVLRDGVLPPPGSITTTGQYDSYHSGDQQGDDWFGLVLPAPLAPGERLIGLEFQEGLHHADGGWFEDLWVEAQSAGTWAPVTGLRIDPPYPFEQAGQPYFDGIGYQTYELRFDPAVGDALRLRGKPGGAAGYASAGELRLLVLRATEAAPHERDISAEGTLAARVLELAPPWPLGVGNPMLETLRNGTWPVEGTHSWWAQYDSLHLGDQGADDWFGYTFAGTRCFSGLVFQEGLHIELGGAFLSLDLERRASDGTWSPVAGVRCDPPYSGAVDPESSYRIYTFDFPPVLGSGLRLRGAPSGTMGYASAAELRVLEPALAPGCGWTAYAGAGAPADQLALSSGTPAAIGLPIELLIGGAPGATTGLIGVSTSSLALPILGGTLLINPLGAMTIPLAFDASGVGRLTKSLPANPGLAGVSFYLQAVALWPSETTPLLFSNGLELRFCAW